MTTETTMMTLTISPSSTPLENPLGIKFNENIESNKGDYIMNIKYVRGHLHFHPWTAWQHSGATLACLLVILKHTSLAPILLTLTLRDIYNVKDPSRSLILISEDSPRGELYHNHNL